MRECIYQIKAPNEKYFYCRSNRIHIHNGSRFVFAEHCLRCTSYDQEHDESKLYPVPDFDDPGWMQKLKNFKAALAEHIKNGLRICEDSIQEIRWNVCSVCPKFRKESKLDKKTGYCSAPGCGCSSVLKKGGMIEKIAWMSSFCPDGNWSRAETDDPAEYNASCLHPISKEKFEI